MVRSRHGAPAASAPSSPSPVRVGERPTEGDPEALRRVAFAEAVNEWRVQTQQQLFQCLPHPSPDMQPEELRVVFSPLPDLPEALGPHLVVSRVERAGIDPLEDDPSPGEFTGEVRDCLDGLLGMQLMLPEGSNELTEGYEELLHVPLG